MAERIKVPIECPRGNQAHKEVWVDPADKNHERECVTCGYTWRWREGMPTYAGEFDAIASVDTVPGVEVTTPAEGAGETATPAAGSEEAAVVEEAPETPARRRR